jgi:beta-mannosidase
MERDGTDVPSTPHPYGEKTVLVDVWGCNSDVTPVEAVWTIEAFEITTGENVLDLGGEITLAANQSTAITKVDISGYNPPNLVVSAALTLSSGEVVRSSADWPQPLKYVSFLERGVKYSVDGEHVNLHVEKPTKAVVLDVEESDDVGLQWSDNGMDIMPGEVVAVHGKGLTGRKVTVNWYGNG